jgi:hypothetical protein
MLVHILKSKIQVDVAKAKDWHPQVIVLGEGNAVVNERRT